MVSPTEVVGLVLKAADAQFLNVEQTDFGSRDVPRFASCSLT